MTRLPSLVVLGIVGVLVLAPIAGAVPTTKRHAELNILRSTRVLARWHVGAIDPRTHTLRSNTVATCTGQGRPTLTASNARLYTRLVCRLRYRTQTVRILYIAQRGRSFELHRLPPQRVFRRRS